MGIKTNISVLIVDDDPSSRTLLSGFLCTYYQTVICAESAEAALRLFESTSFDVVISDFNMPGMDGARLTCQMKKKKDIPVIGISGEENLDLFESAGADYCLSKPLSLLHLLKTVQDSVSEKGPESERSEV